MLATVPAIVPDPAENCRRQWRQMALSALYTTSDGAGEQALARQLHALRTLLGEGGVPVGTADSATSLQPRLNDAQQVAERLRCVNGEEQAPALLQRCLDEAAAAPDVLAQRWLAQQTLAVLEWLHASCEAPHAAALPTLMRLCRQLYALLEVAQRPSWRERLRQVEIVLLAHFLRGQPFDAAVLQQCSGFFWALHYCLPDTWMPQIPLAMGLPDASMPQTPLAMGPPHAGSPQTSSTMRLPYMSFTSSLVAGNRGMFTLSEATGIDCAPIGEVPACMTPALQRMQGMLASAECAAPPSAPMVLQGYELAVVALQLRAMAAAILFGCLQALLVEHWSQALPLAERRRRCLQKRYGAARLEPGTLREALYELAEIWPPAHQSADLQVPLAGDGGSSAGSIRLAAIPTLLSRRLPTLNAARQAWFARQEEFAPHQLALQSELMMLERGAAAFKVRGIERLCGRLLELLMLLDLQGTLARFPGALLWRAHCHLLHLLDAAAAWWEAAPDQELLQALQDRSRQLLPAPPPANRVAEPAALGEDEAWHEVRRQLLGYVQSFSSLLDIQMRLEISGDGATWPVERLWRLQAALMPLLRYLLLEFSLALEQRRALRLPTTGCLWLCLQRDAEGGPQAQLRDDSAHQAPGAVQWQQLQHRVLKYAGAGIRCEETTLGRCFTLTLPLVLPVSPGGSPPRLY